MRILRMIATTVAIAATPMSAIADVTAAQVCQGAKNLAAGKYAACRQKAETILASGGDATKYDQAIGKCESKLASAWRKAEQKAADDGATCLDDAVPIDSFKSAIDIHCNNIATALAGGGLDDCDAELATCDTDRDTCSSALLSCSGGTAASADVRSGKTFAGAGGLSQVGTMSERGAPSVSPGAAAVPLAAGYYSGGQVEGDADLNAVNIRSGVQIFGVTGSSLAATGNAAATDVLSGASFSNGASSALSGSMPNIGQQNIMPGVSAAGISAGYHDGTGSVAGDSDLMASNIIDGVDIFGVAGNLVAATGNAAAAEVRAGKTFANSGGVSVGIMPDNGAVILTPTTSAQSIAAGYHNGNGKCAGDPDLAAANISAGVDMFGVAGTAVSGQRLKTEASVCYDASDAVIPCAGTGQDGELQPGVTRQYVDNGNGTITDQKSGLTWEKLVPGTGVHGYDWKPWSAVMSKIATLNSTAFGGYTDWRVPNVNELFSLVSYRPVTNGAPKVPAIFNQCCGDILTCSCTYAGYTWTSTAAPGSPSQAILVEFSEGYMISATRSGSPSSVRAVRGGV